MNYFRSPQEVALLQSDRGQQGFNHKGDPYRIFALDQGDTIEDSLRAREGMKLIAWASYFGLEGNFVRISVEPINTKGRTTRDPVPLREDGMPMSPAEYSYSANFPFRRK